MCNTMVLKLRQLINSLGEEIFNTYLGSFLVMKVKKTVRA